MIRPPPRSPLFPYPTLFRSRTRSAAPPSIRPSEGSRHTNAPHSNHVCSRVLVGLVLLSHSEWSVRRVPDERRLDLRRAAPAGRIALRRRIGVLPYGHGSVAHLGTARRRAEGARHH